MIDGYNLTGIVHRDFELARNMLLARLVEFNKGRGHDITVVFDGWKSGGPVENRTVEQGIEVIFTRLGDKADDVIKRIVTGDKYHIVISSDREIQTFAWSQSSVPLSSDEFVSILEGDIEIEDRFQGGGKRGSSRTPSKKEKLRQRAIEKLID